MREYFRYLRDVLVSLKFTVLLVAFSIILVFAATLDQTNLGVWGIQQKWFRTFVVYQEVGGLALPLFPGGYLVGGLLLLNLIAAHIYRFTLAWKKIGILLAHFGLILLLVGELLTGLWQEEYFMRLDNGQTQNYSESYQHNELAVIDTSSAATETVVAIPESLLAAHASVQQPGLPFRVVSRVFYPNSVLQARPPAASTPNFATIGAGLSLDTAPQPITYRPDTNNIPSAYVELIAPEGTLGIYLVSTALPVPQTFQHAGKTWALTLRAKRAYHPFSLTLEKFNHDRYAGTDIPKNFSSRVHLRTPEGHDDRAVVISMNNPLRHDGLTFYQAGFANNDRTTVLQVVRNPSWLLPYVACALMSAGLLFQFGLHLIAFVKRRRLRTNTPHPAATGVHPKIKAPLLPRLVLLGALVYVAATFFPSRSPDAFDLVGFGRLPTLVNGRLKPLDTVARTTLLATQGRQRVSTPDGRRVTAAAWLLDVLYRPDLADTYQTFEIVHPEVLTVANLAPEQGAGKKRFSLAQLRPALPELERQANLADGIDAPLRTPFQRSILKLRDNIVLYQRLQASFVAPGVDNYLDRASRFAAGLDTANSSFAATTASAAPDPAANRELLSLAAAFATLDTLGYLLPVPPESDLDQLTSWKNLGASFKDALTSGHLNPAAATFLALGVAWRDQDATAFNTATRSYRARLAAAIPGRIQKCDIESRFNSAQPFYTSSVLYVAAFLVGVVSWLRWPRLLGPSAYRLVLVAFVLSSVGIATRMWLESRPPVTNLYSSALFVGWGAVALCLFLEAAYKNAIGSVAAGLIGFATLLIAHHLSLGGDTLEMMRAVLDSNFWLATHVVTVTVGYSATFLAGFLALIYVFRGVFTRSLDAATADALARMVYGIVCFATLFSFVGTVLGGIWADQSWGRFWGWDPKENGALIIVLWNALILHARWGGLVKTRGLMMLAIFGNVITAWSWFGVNMLGVGLHSYGFMDSAFWWLIAFAASQSAAILIAALPFQSPARS